MEKQKSTNPGVQQIIDILRPYRTEAMADYTSLNRIMEFVTRIEKRSRSEKIKHDINIPHTVETKENKFLITLLEDIDEEHLDNLLENT